MKLLGIDSSSLVASVAVVTDDVLTAEYTVDFKKTHSQTLLPMIDEVVEKKDAESAYKHLIQYNKEALGMIIKWQ